MGFERALQMRHVTMSIMHDVIRSSAKKTFRFLKQFRPDAGRCGPRPHQTVRSQPEVLRYGNQAALRAPRLPAKRRLFLLRSGL